MKDLLRRLDAGLIAVPHQWLVDKTQRERAWWMRQCVLFLICARVIRVAIEGEWNGYTAVWLLVFLLICGFLVLISHHEALIEVWTRPLMRGIAVSLTLPFWMLFLVVILVGRTGVNPLVVVGDVAYLSFFYFGACKRPAPPKRCEQHNLGFSA